MRLSPTSELTAKGRKKNKHMIILKKFCNVLNSTFGIDDYFEIDEIDTHILTVGLDEGFDE